MQLHDYLSLLAGDEPTTSFWDLRHRTPNGMTRALLRLDRRSELTIRAVRLARRTDVYLGCAPRARRAGGRSAIERAWTLWVECDDPASVQKLRAFTPRPSALIRSGTSDNLHAYFALTEPVDPDTLEAANRRLVAAVDGDPICYDAARILRPPTTLNFKHNPPRAVTAEWIDPTARRPLVDWVHGLPEPPSDAAASARPAARPVQRRYGRDRNAAFLRAIPADVYITRLAEIPPIPRNRKIHCPFHDDRTPSLHVYEDPERGWTCFGCRRGGSIYDFAAPILGIGTSGDDFLRLQKELTERFDDYAPRRNSA